MLYSDVKDELYPTKEDITHIKYILHVFKHNDARQSLYKVFDANGTKIIGVLRRTEG